MLGQILVSHAIIHFISLSVMWPPLYLFRHNTLPIDTQFPHPSKMLTEVGRTSNLRRRDCFIMWTAPSLKLECFEPSGLAGVIFKFILIPRCDAVFDSQPAKGGI